MKLIDEWRKKPLESKLWMLGGMFFLALTAVGLFLPIMPQLPFAIVGAFSFSRGSPTIHKWLRNHEKMGPTLRDWEDHHVLRPKLKMISTLAMLVGSILAWSKFHHKHALVAVGIILLFALAIIFVLTRKSHPYEYVTANF